jgi:hypothetical protein
MSVIQNKVEKFNGQVVFADCPMMQVMSDIWDYCPYGIIAKPDGTFERVWADTTPVVDATDELIKAYTDKVEADRKARDLANRKQKAMDYLYTLRTGKTVEVVRGRKVAKGTKGILFYMKEGQFGVNVGIALDTEKDSRGRFINVAWTYAQNIQNVVTREEIDAIENMA